MATAYDIIIRPIITEAVKHETMHHRRVFGSDGKA